FCHRCKEGAFCAPSRFLPHIHEVRIHFPMPRFAEEDQMSESLCTPEFAAGYREAMLQGFTKEVETTKRVLAAVPDAKRDYRPDEHARKAWELAWHLANTDIQFMDGIADLNFKMETPEEADKPKTVAELVEWYGNSCDRALARVRALTPEQLATP